MEEILAAPLCMLLAQCLAGDGQALAAASCQRFSVWGSGPWHEMTVPTSSFSTALCAPTSPSPSPSPHCQRSALLPGDEGGEEEGQKHPAAGPRGRADAGSPKWYPPQTSQQPSVERAASLPHGAEPGHLCPRSSNTLSPSLSHFISSYGCNFAGNTRPPQHQGRPCGCWQVLGGVWGSLPREPAWVTMGSPMFPFFGSPA